MKNTKLLSFLLLIAAVWGCKKEVNDLPSPSEVPLASVDSIVANSNLTVPGSLLWYKHKGYLKGTISWANGGAGIQVGSGWANFKSVFATDSGVIYGIQTDGKLIWYKHKGYLNGTTSWANGGAGIQVGSGWANFKSVFATNNGVIYGVRADGKLIWYKHNGYLTGTSSWANGGAGIQVGGPGWANFKSVFATNNGVIYGIQTDGKLIWYKHKGYLNGTISWANGGGGTEIGSGWANFKSVFATNDGVMYGVNP